MIKDPSSLSPTITIIGSYNEDITLVNGNFPQPGETVMASRLVRGHGGKGSNQAIAAHHFGARTRLVARLGDDEIGQAAIVLYKQLGIDISYVCMDKEHPTGTAVILVNQTGQNMISIAPGANLFLDIHDINAACDNLKDISIVGFQLENNLEAVFHGLKLVHGKGVITFLDPAPAQHLPDDLYRHISILKPNISEASLLSGVPVTGVQDAMTAGNWFLRRGVHTVIITLGNQGTVLVSGQERRHFPTFEVTPVDATGAGDIFSGAFLASYAAGDSLYEAIHFANAAAALSTQKFGVIDSIPPVEKVLALREKLAKPTSEPPSVRV